MDVAGTRRHINQEIIEFAPIGITNQLAQGIRRHAATPQHRGVFINKKTYRKQLHPVAFMGNNKFSAVDMVHIKLGILHTEHFRHRRAEYIGIKQPHLVAFTGKSHSQVRGHGRFPHPTFSGAYADNIFHLSERPDGRLRSFLARFNRDIPLYVDLRRDIGGNRRFRGLDERFYKRVRRLVKHQREADFIAVDAYVIFNHPGIHNVFSGGRITHIFQRIKNQLGV